MFKKFYKTFLFYGIIAVLLGVIGQLVIINKLNDESYKLMANIVSTALTTIGIGLVVGYVMDMTKNSAEYTEYFQKQLKKTVVSRDFISDLSDEEKNKIVERCLTTDSTHEMLSKYVRYKSGKISNLCNGHLRSDIDYMTTAKMTNKGIVLSTDMKYTIYKVNNAYQKITHLFQKENGEIISLKIINSNKEVYDVPKAKLKTEKITQNQNDDDIAYENKVEIPAHLKSEKSLIVKSQIKEYGYDHWACLEWMSLYPTDGISYKIICENGLIIKNYMIFDDQRGLYSTNIEKNDNGEIVKLTISCDDWTDPYTGFSLVIAKP